MTLLSTTLSAADAVAGRLGRLDRPIRVAGLIAAARRRAGSDDFGDDPFMGPLERLCSACLSEAQLSLLGRAVTSWDIGRFLDNLLLLRQQELRDPAILREKIEQPLFITGLPRTGTTFLHRLLLEDATNESPRAYQTIHPYPLAGEADGGPAKRIAAVNRQLRMFDRLAPEFRSLHPMDATSPQECSEITAHVFASLRFDTTYDIPSYREWLDASGHVDAFRVHKRFLQHLQHQTGPRRWVLKCPDHVFALDAIRTVYPDARVVFVHRDPMRVLASVVRLTEILRRPFTRSIDRVKLGRKQNDRWQEGTQLMRRAAERQDFAEAICQVRHTELIAAPALAIERIYAHFGLTLGEQAARRIEAVTAETPNGGYGVNQYRLEDYGLDEAEERRRFAPYMEAFAVAPESARERDARRRPQEHRASVPRAA
ncbi:MAG TPA: sulfotransferase [Acidisphaera sp.]|nr:sulfotransferase [Acidisphaera sp.]